MKAVFAGIAAAVVALSLLWFLLYVDHETRHIKYDMEECALAYYSVYERWPRDMKDVESVRRSGQSFEGFPDTYIFSETPDGIRCYVGASVGFPIGDISVVVQRPSTDEAISIRESATRFSLNWNYQSLSDLDRVWLALRDFARIHHLAVGAWPQDASDIDAVLNEYYMKVWRRVLDDSGATIKIISAPSARTFVAVCTSASGKAIRVEAAEPTWSDRTLVLTDYVYEYKR